MLVASAAIVAAGCRWLDGGNAPADAAVFTPAHPTTVGAVKDFFGVRPRAEQPIAFPHRVHLAKGLTCTDYCHESASKGPIAGLPSIKTCMICHDAIATDRPDVIGDPHLDTGRDRGQLIERFFNPAAFKAAAGLYGTAGRNILYGPGAITWDFSGFKYFRVTERHRAEFRAEFFNSR